MRVLGADLVTVHVQLMLDGPGHPTGAGPSRASGALSPQAGELLGAVPGRGSAS